MKTIKQSVLDRKIEEGNATVHAWSQERNGDLVADVSLYRGSRSSREYRIVVADATLTIRKTNRRTFTTSSGIQVSYPAE